MITIMSYIIKYFAFKYIIPDLLIRVTLCHYLLPLSFDRINDKIHFQIKFFTYLCDRCFKELAIIIKTLKTITNRLIHHKS